MKQSPSQNMRKRDMKAIPKFEENDLDELESAIEKNYLAPTDEGRAIKELNFIRNTEMICKQGKGPKELLPYVKE